MNAVMTCEKCGKGVPIAAGGYIYARDRMLFVCKDCAKTLDDEAEKARKICRAVDENKTEAERITNDRDAFDRFLDRIGETLKKIPRVGNLLCDIPLLVSLVKSYVEGAYKEIPYNSIIAVVATLLYVISPIDLIPDAIPVIGFADDAAAVAFCVKMIHDDLEKYRQWRDQRAEEP
ncbi:MAG: DUF1232 domain-containing protein [Clostridia bacterium]|nr:DUF1232 domain-containing protein [Clostridia bacterium]